jgi:SanA protein
VWLVLLLLSLTAVVAVALPAWTLVGRYRERIRTTPEEVPPRSVALVFGAGYWPDGTPSDVMRDRVEAAVDLYRAGRVRKVLFSGDNSRKDYDEPEKMREIALGLGMPADDIVLDYAGRRTYDTCYRAQAIFGLREVILVTQRYHMPRALYTCRRLGLDAVGYVADRRPYVHIRWYWAREIPALWLAWWDVWIRRPVPILGQPVLISED